MQRPVKQLAQHPLIVLRRCARVCCDAVRMPPLRFHHPCEEIALKPHHLLAALPLCLAFAGTAQAQDSAASATLSFIVTPSDPAGLVWLVPDSFSTSEATAAAFDRWEADGVGGFSPVFGAPSTEIDLQPGLWTNSSSALATGGLNFSSSFTFAPSTRNASLQSSASVVDGGFGSGLAFVRSYFSLAPGASVTFNGTLSLSVFGQNQAFPDNYTTTDLYGFASGLLAVGGGDVDELEIGNASLPYAAGAYAFNDVAPLSVSFTNSSTETVVAFLDSGVSVYSVSAVPEPGTYAMLFAGIAAIGVLVRRRQQRD
jgi:hypothetical protein